MKKLNVFTYLSLTISIFLLFGFKVADTSDTVRSILPAGKLKKVTFYYQDIKRSYLIYVPVSYNRSKPAPLLFDIHGGGGTARGTIKLTKSGFNQLADEKGFIVVYPNAVKRNWNDGRLKGVAFVDDVGFIANIVAKVMNEYNIDSKRIFTTGMSNGGFMSSRLLCERSDIFRGGAIVTATISVDYIDKCSPEYPLGVMIMNGTGDPLVPYTGGQVKVFRKEYGAVVSTDDYVAYWQGVLCNTDAHSSQDLPDYNALDGSTVNVKTFTDCKENTALVLYKIKGGGHTWPGGKQYLKKKIIGMTNRDINACDVIWEFFESLPERN